MPLHARSTGIETLEDRLLLSVDLVAPPEGFVDGPLAELAPADTAAPTADDIDPAPTPGDVPDGMSLPTDDSPDALVDSIQMGPFADAAEIDGSAAAAPQAVTTATPHVVRRYAPLVWLNSNEKNFPTTGQSFINHSHLRWAKPLLPDDNVDSTVDASRLGVGSSNPYTHDYSGGAYKATDYTRPRGTEADRKGLPTGYGFFLDLDNDFRGGMTSTSTNNRVYTSAARVYYDYQAGKDITYWFFYAYNDGFGPQNHEGDWERIEVHLNARNRAVSTEYHQHAGSQTLSWADTPKVGRTHPVVFSAQGSHASYPTAGSHHFGTDHTNRGKAWSTWDALIDVRTRPFYGFGGAWGEVGNISDTTGPLGPSRYK
jgi:hypothetical protein